MILPYSPGTISVLVGVAMVAGLVRGFTGFGAAMIFMPVASVLVGPKIAVILIWTVDLLASMPILIPALSKARWRDVLPVGAGSAMTVWLGVYWLKHGDAEAVRWVISAAILVVVLVLWSGWRYLGPRPIPLSLVVGWIAGFAGGAAQLSGPPAVVYWMASPDAAWQVRANIITLIFITALMSGATLYVNGLFVQNALVGALICAPVYLLAIVSGQRFFGMVSEQGFRRFVFFMILAVAVLTLPVFDEFLR
jgi:uncharacterized membrane protein YfcA